MPSATPAGRRPIRLLAAYHRANTFGGSFNSIVDVLGRLDRARFEPLGLLPGPGNCSQTFIGLRVPVLQGAERPGGRSAAYALAVAGQAWLLRRHRIDLVYVADYVTWRSSLLTAARLAGVPSVVHVRMPLAPEPLDPALLGATLVVGNSRASIAALAKARPADRTRVIYNFVDVDRFATGRDLKPELFGGTPVVIGFVGIFRPEKGIEHFIDAAALLRASYPDVRFLAVGGESAVEDIGWLSRMRQYATARGLDDVMRFTGERSDVPDLMHSIDVLVVPSLNEGFGRVIVEAGAAGVPAIGADAAGIPEVIEQGVSGLLVPPADGAAIASAVSRLLADPGLRRSMGARARERARAVFAPAPQMAALEQAWTDAATYSRRA